MQQAALLLILLPLVVAAQPSDELLNDNDVRDIYLEMSPDDWASLKQNYLDDTKYPATFVWNSTRLEQVTVRSRGSGSRNPVKPSLKIDFDSILKDRTWDGMKSIVLDNNVQDLSMIRERTVMKAMRALGVPAPRESSGRLFVNGEYLGIFTIIEPLDKMYLKKQFGESSGTLYEYNAVQVFNFEDLGSDPAAYVPDSFEPKTNEDAPQADVLVDFIRTLNAASDADFARELARFVDVDAFLLFTAVQQYFAEVDGINGWNGANNFYLYQSGGRFTFIPWDMDLSFFASELSVLYNFESNVITRRIWADPQLRSKYLQAVRRVADFCGGPNGWLESELEWANRQVHPNVSSDPTVGCTDGTGASVPCDGTPSPYDVEMEAVRTFGRERYNNVMQELNGAEATSGNNGCVAGLGASVGSSSSNCANGNQRLRGLARDSADHQGNP